MLHSHMHVLGPRTTSVPSGKNIAHEHHPQA